MCARTQFMTGSFLWADRPIMSKTNETMKHNAEAIRTAIGQLACFEYLTPHSLL